MQLPSVVHPKKFSVKGMFFEVVSYATLTDEQASKVAMLFYRSGKFTKMDQGKLFRVVTQFDENSSDLI